jgi:hypothetical protein
MSGLQIEIPRESIEAIAREVFERSIADFRPGVYDEEADQITRTLQKINAKQFITIGEFQFLFGCSRGYVDKLLGEAAAGTSDHPVPYCDLNGLCVFERVKVLAWAAESKTLKVKQKKSGGRRLKAVKAS